MQVLTEQVIKRALDGTFTRLADGTVRKVRVPAQFMPVYHTLYVPALQIKSRCTYSAEDDNTIVKMTVAGASSLEVAKAIGRARKQINNRKVILRTMGRL